MPLTSNTVSSRHCFTPWTRYWLVAVKSLRSCRAGSNSMKWTVVAVGPTQTARAVLRLRLAAEPAEDGLLDVGVLTHEAAIFEASRTLMRPVSRSCISDFLSSARPASLVASAEMVAFDAFITLT